MASIEPGVIPENCLWTYDGSVSAGAVAEMFAKRYWNKPRKLDGPVKPDGTFKVVDGVATYRVELVPATRWRRGLWAIVRLPEFNHGA